MNEYFNPPTEHMLEANMTHKIKKRTFRHVRPAKIQISMRIRIFTGRILGQTRIHGFVHAGNECWSDDLSLHPSAGTFSHVPALIFVTTGLTIKVMYFQLQKHKLSEDNILK